MSVAFQSFDRELTVERLTACCASTIVKLIKLLVLSSLRAQHAFVLGWFGADEFSKSHGELTPFLCDLTKANYLADNCNRRLKIRQP